MTKTGIIKTLNRMQSNGILNKIYDSGYVRKYQFIDNRENSNTRMNIIVFNNDDVVTFRIKYQSVDLMQIIQKRYCDFRNMHHFKTTIMDIIQKYIIDCEYA